MQRLSAEEIERVVSEALHSWTPQISDPLKELRSIRLTDEGLLIALACKESIRSLLKLCDGERIIDQTNDTVTILLPLRLPLRGGKKLIVKSHLAPPRPDDVLIAALRKAHAMLANERGFPIIQAAPVSPYDRKILRLAFLTPDIQRAIVMGRQPQHLFLEKIQHMTIPLSWNEQRKTLGFQHRKTGVSGE